MRINDTNIVKDTDPLIREKSEDVQLPLSKEDEDILMDMLQYVLDSTDEEIAERENLKPAVGISAIQIGIRKKMTAIALKDEEGNVVCQYALVNPKIVSSSIEQTALGNGEGCLSVEDEHQGLIYRSHRIKVKAYDALKKEEVTFRVSGYLAVVFQHELDHFKGILFYDHINKDDPFRIDDKAIIIE